MKSKSQKDIKTSMFIAALFTIVMMLKQSKCPMDEDNGIFLYKKKEILLFVSTWMNLEDTMLSEISQTQEDRYHFYEESKIMKLIEAESRMGVSKGWGGDIWGDIRQGVQSSVYTR